MRTPSELKPSSSLFWWQRSLYAGAIAALLAAVCLGAYFYIQRNTYTTSLGEQRSLLLSDGSTVDLNAQTRVRVSLAEDERRVDLVSGEALFRVAKDRTRPFIVVANGTQIRAVGTQFDVTHRKRGLTVTVVEGTVAVSSTPPQLAPGTSVIPREILLGAGQKMTLSSVATATHAIRLAPRPQPADVDVATAWTRRRLIFDSTPLDEVADEFNRNNARPLVIEGDGLEDFHISGAFSSTDLQPLLRFLRAQAGIRVIENDDKIVISRAR
jgi:transmembrane sensor